MDLSLAVTDEEAGRGAGSWPCARAVVGYSAAANVCAR